MTLEGCFKMCGPRGDARRRAILDAAWTLFLEKGFERTTLADIIALSGGSRSTVYEAFGDKDGLFETVITLKCEEFVERFRNIPFNHSDPERALADFGMNFVQGILSPDSPKIMRLMIANADQLPRAIDAFLKGGPATIKGILSDYLRSATARGELNVADPDRAAATFMGLLHGDQYLKMLLRPSELATPEEMARHVEAAVGIFLDGVR